MTSLNPSEHTHFSAPAPTAERPTRVTPPTPTEHGRHGTERQTNDPNKKKRRRNRTIAGVAIGTVVGGALAVGLPFALKNDGNTGTNNGEGDPVNPDTEQVVTNPGNYIIDLEELADMSPEQLRDAGTITVESVTGPDGNIDWNLYAQKLTEVRLLASMSGTTGDEMVEAYRGENGDQMWVVIDEAYTPLYEGFATPDANLDNEHTIHQSMIQASFSAYRLKTEPIVRTLDLLNSDVQPGASNDGATINMTLHTTDNFFSSGALNANEPKVVEQMGRNTDMNLTYTEGVVAVVIDGKIYASMLTNG